MIASARERPQTISVGRVESTYRPARVNRAANWLRLLTFNLAKMEPNCAFTVCRLLLSSCAIRSLPRPSETSHASSRSRGLKRASASRFPFNF